MNYPETAASGAALVYYFISSLTASCIPSKHNKKRGQRQQLCHLTASSLVLGVSLALGSVQAVRIGTIGRHGDDSLLSDLLYTLMWIVLLLAHIDHPSHVRYPHVGAWIFSALARCFALSRHSLVQHSHHSLDHAITALIVCQIVAPAGLLVFHGTLALTRTDEVHDNAETQPLLDNVDPDANTKKDEEEEHSRESAEGKKAREELHNRPLREYLRSFLIYVPLLWPSTRQQKIHFVGLCASALVMRLITVLVPLALGNIIDTLARGDAPWLAIGIYFLLYYAQSRTGVALLEDYLRLVYNNTQTLTLSRAAYNHIMDLSADFQDAKTSSDVWQAMSQSTSVITLFNSMAFDIVPMLIDLATGFALLWGIFGPYMGVLVLHLMVLIIWASIKAVRSRVGLSRKWRDSWYSAYHQMVDSTENWFTVAQFGQIGREKSLYRENQLIVLEGRMKLYYWLWRTGISRFGILTSAYLLAAALAALEIHNNELKVGAFITLTGYWAQVSSPIMYIVHEITDIADKLVDAEKLLVLLEKKPTVFDAPGAKPYEFRGGAVEFQEVSFTYDGKKEATQDLSFCAAPGTVTALVGETGGGKSTVLKLLMRFYDPEKGRVLIDGQELSQLQLESFRKHIGVVPQEPSMFHTTILDNVRYSNPDLSEEAVEEACKAAALHDKIMTFAKGYQTKVGERGCQLSGGEKQRLAIARAILKKPNILLLDEATSSVDSVTEGSIQASLDEVCKDRTTFVIAHRLSTIMKADLILVIEGGKLVEKGTHAGLIKNTDGAYHKLWKSQLKLQGESISRNTDSSDETNHEVPTLVNSSDATDDEMCPSDDINGEKSADDQDERSRQRNKTCSESNAVVSDDEIE